MAFGLALKSVSFFLRIIEFCCAAIILGIFSYFLATLHNHSLPIATYIRAVEGISGAGILYTVFALMLVCFLGGIAFLSTIAMLLDLAFCGAFIYVAWATRGGASSCKGNVNTPFGSGNTSTGNSVASGSSGFTELPSLHTACKLETATFAVAIVAAIFFFLSIFVEFALIRHHKKEKAFGPSPNNGYTAGSPRRKFWQRKPKHRDAEMAAQKSDALPAHQTPADFRTSYATDTTAVGQEPVYNKYGASNMTGAGHANGVPQTIHAGHQTTTTTQAGGYTPYRAENATGTF
jgi:hypothetical protein